MKHLLICDLFGPCAAFRWLFFMNLCQVQRKELKKRTESVRWENPRAQDNLRAICVCVLLPYPPCAVDNGTFECKVKSDKSRQIKCAIFSFTIVWYKAWLQRYRLSNFSIILHIILYTQTANIWPSQPGRDRLGVFPPYKWPQLEPWPLSNGMQNMLHFKKKKKKKEESMQRRKKIQQDWRRS